MEAGDAGLLGGRASLNEHQNSCSQPLIVYLGIMVIDYRVIYPLTNHALLPFPGRAKRRRLNGE